MTFGEHLEELRRCLVHAILWLAAGLVIGLFFADSVIQFIQTPLEQAIQDYRADRDLNRLGYELDDPKVQPIREFLASNALIWEIIYDIPEELQDLTMDSMVPNASASTESKTDVPLAVKPLEMAELLRSLPDPSVLKPKIQLRESKTGLSSLKIEEPFMIWVKAGLIVGAVLASPMILYHLWTFVAAGLHSHERKHVYIYLPVSVALFGSGVVLAFSWFFTTCSRFCCRSTREWMWRWNHVSPIT